MNLKFNNPKENKNEKKQIWTYALILFTGAFIVLLLTAYSQVKFQNNISDYQNKLSSQEKAKINAVTDFNTAIKENKSLKTEIEGLREKLVESEQKLATEETKSVDLETKFNNAAGASDQLLTAQDYYVKDDYINCAVTLKYGINIEYLSSKALQIYNDLASKSYSKASLSLYRDGYKSYRKKNYNDAIVNFNRAIDFSKQDDYYIDDAYFYLATSYYRINNYTEAKRIITVFTAGYPKSSFVSSMKALEKKMP